MSSLSSPSMTLNNTPYFKQLIGFGLIFDIVIIDQISKWFVLEHLLRNQINPNEMPLGLIDWFTSVPERLPFTSIEITSFFNLVMVWNQGISFGLFQMSGPAFLIILSLLITIFFGIWLARTENWLEAIGLGMVIGGALGNVIDRARFGAVADFLDFHAFGLHYPAFNIADSCITIGIALVLFHAVFLDRKKEIS